jgi:hypothetical protein
MSIPELVPKTYGGVQKSLSTAPGQDSGATGDSKSDRTTRPASSLDHTVESVYAGYPAVWFTTYRCKCGFESVEIDGIALHCYTAGLEAGRKAVASTASAPPAPAVVVRGQESTTSSSYGIYRGGDAACPTHAPFNPRVGGSTYTSCGGGYYGPN